MDLLTLRYWLLIMHLCGLVLMVGTTVTEFAAFRTFINLLKTKGELSTGLLKLLSGLISLLIAGGALLIISGAGLILITGGAFLYQGWLKVKLLLILLLALNGMLVGGPQMKRLKGGLSDGDRDISTIIGRTVFNLNIFHSLQLLLFLAVVVLAVFKFS